MTNQGSHLSLACLADLFYQCKFSRLLEVLRRHVEAGGELPTEAALIKANALFERHEVPEALRTIENVRARNDDFDAAYLYAAARVSFLDDRFADARVLFSQIHEAEQDHAYRFKSLLGIANTYYSERNYGPLTELIARLHAFEPLPKADERISFLIFLGNYHLAIGAGADLAKGFFAKGLAQAATESWTYFITHCLYGLATVCEKSGQMAELMWTLEVLRTLVNESEQKQFCSRINQHFKDYVTINTPMEFDTHNKRVMLKNRWLPLHDKPLLYRFLLLLHEQGRFVEKATIAHELWPDEPYKPRIHDPRIFDIAKRARNMIESYESQPVVLLSGRLGYKLASV